MKSQQDNMIVQGWVPITKSNMESSWTTLVNQSAVLVNTYGVSIYDTVVSKSRERYSVKNSLISSMGRLIT